MSLYRKYRPQTFEDVVGQEHIAQTLRNALGSDPIRVAHAYLFCGPRGTGKTTTARLLAKCVNCEQGPTATPCNVCDFCTSVRDNHAVMDLVEIDAASNTQVDKVRENIVEKVNMAPAIGRYRVYIIDEVHMLSGSSFNALLKTLEEPPAHAIFVLATTDAHKVPTTVTSRCQRFDFRRVGPNDIVHRLQYVASSEGMEIELPAAQLIARTADGALRDALTLLEQVAAFAPAAITDADVRLVLGTVSQELLLAMVDAIAAAEPAAALAHIERATEEGVSFMQLTRDLTGYCRELLLLTIGYEGTAGGDSEERRRHHEQARHIGRTRLLYCVEALRTAEKEMRNSTDHRLLLELTLVRACDDAPEPAAAAPLGTPVVAVPQGRVAPVGRPASAEARPAPPRPETQRPQPPVQHEAPSWREPAPAPSVVASPPQRPKPVETPPLAVVVPVAAAPDMEGPALDDDEADYMADGANVYAEPTMTVEPIVTVDPVVAEEAAPPAEPDAVPTGGAPASEEMAPPAAGGAPRKGRRIHDLDEFKELWPAVLVRVKKKIGVSAVAYLHDALPVALNEEEAVVEFQKEFHYAKACEAAGRLPFEQVLNECMVSPRRLRFRLAPPPDAPEPEPEPETPPDDDDDFENDVVERARVLFGAEVVGRSGGG